MIIETLIIIEDTRFNKEITDIELWCQKVCTKSWETACLYNENLPKEEVEISVVLTDDEKIRQLNKDYRGKDKPTNVISFASIDSEEIDSGLFIAGDIIISYDTTLKESTEKGFKNHFTHLLIHGVMHLCGFDHENDGEATEMENIEIEILKNFGIANPY